MSVSNKMKCKMDYLEGMTSLHNAQQANVATACCEAKDSDSR